jgi:hypothetical protein
MAAFGASLAQAMTKKFRDMTKVAAGEDADAPRTPSRVLPSRLLGIDGGGIFVRAALKLEPWELRRPRRRGLNKTQERWFRLRTVRQS